MKVRNPASVNYLVYLAAFAAAGIGAPGFLSGQSAIAPENILSKHTLVLVHAKDTEQLIGNLKTHWYDLFYSDAVEQGKLRPLDLPVPAEVFKNSGWSDGHWLLSAFESLNQRERGIGRQITESLASLVDDPRCGNRNSNDLVADIASLFPGQGFVAVDKTDSGLVYVYGIEFDPEHFDWYEEMLQTLEKQAGTRAEVARIDETPIFHLEQEQRRISLRYRETDP